MVLLLALLGLNALGMISIVILVRRARKAQRRRVVERPNSQYKSKYVLDLESSERWERLDLKKLHEVNREEAARIIKRLKAVSARGLTAYERDFLDRMVEAEHRVEKTERRGHGAPRPAAG